MKRQLPFLVALTVLVCAFANACSARREQEATLKQELRMMRAAIDAYTLEKQRAPQSLQDLVNDHYLKEIPTDPFTRKKDWVPRFDSVVLSPDQEATGMVDIHSNSPKASPFDGTPYNEW